MSGPGPQAEPTTPGSARPPSVRDTSGRPVPLTAERRQWLSEIYEAHYRSVFRACLRVLRDAEEAADAAQEVFVLAADAFDNRWPGRDPRPWLLAISRNHSVDLLRRRQRFGKALATIGNLRQNSADPEAAVIDRQMIHSVLRDLSLRERTALWQSAVERRSLADIATGLRLNYMAAAQVLSRARRHAAMVAARVAVVFGIIRISRLLHRDGVTRPITHLSAVNVAALALVPLAAITIQSSGSASQPGGSAAAPGAISRTSQAPAPGLGLGAFASRNQQGPLPGSPLGTGNQVSQSVGASVSNLLDAVPSVTRGLLTTPPVPTPSLPAPSLPSASAIPTPPLPH